MTWEERLEEMQRIAGNVAANASHMSNLAAYKQVDRYAVYAKRNEILRQIDYLQTYLTELRTATLTADLLKATSDDKGKPSFVEPARNDNQNGGSKR